MAIWQFQCNIIPMRVNSDGLSRDEVISWKGVSQPSHEIKFIKREQSWSEDIIQYGKSDETCIEFIYNNNMLDEINCRLDLRRLTKAMLIALVKYVQEIDAMFLVGDMVCLPKIEDMIEVIKNSEANQYCKSPMEYILNLSNALKEK